MGELLRFVLGIESRLQPVSRTAVGALAPWREGSPASLGYDARTMRAPSPSKTVGLLAYDDMQVLDLAGPLDVFGGANAFARGAPPYALCVFGLQAQAVRAENGLSIVPALAQKNVPPLDTLLIPGGMGRAWRCLAMRACSIGCASVPGVRGASCRYAPARMCWRRRACLTVAASRRTGGMPTTWLIAIPPCRSRRIDCSCAMVASPLAAG